MKPTHINLIKLLSTYDRWVTTPTLAHQLNVSTRSIRNYVAEISRFHPFLIESSAQGYKINTLEYSNLDLTNHDPNDIPQTHNERVHYVLINLLRTHDDIDAYDLCDLMYISLTTLKSTLKTVKSRLASYDLTLTTKQDMLNIIGSERNKRKLLNDLIYEESSVNFLNLNSVQSTFSDIDVIGLRDILSSNLMKHEKFINDYATTSIVLHITIAIDRIKRNHTKTSTNPKNETEKLSDITKSILDIIEKKYTIVFNQVESYDLHLLLMSHISDITVDKNYNEPLLSHVDSSVKELVAKLIKSVSLEFDLDLSYEGFYTRFVLHVKNLLTRCELKQSNRNPLAEEIRVSSPLIYEVAVYMAMLIENEYNYEINTDEIAYLAFHIGSALETQKATASKINVAIYSPNYYNMNDRIIEYFNKNFADEIIITNILTYEHELKDELKCDLIISTIPLTSVISTLSLQISIRPTEKDSFKIRQKISDIKVNKKREIFISKMKTISSEKFFYMSDNSETIDDTLQIMCQPLINMGYVNSNFKSEVLDREKLSSTAFNNFAIPHALKMSANKTVISFLISKSGIKWDEKTVNFVVLLAFNKNERMVFNEIFDTISAILIEPENVNKLIGCNSYDQLIKSLANYISLP